MAQKNFIVRQEIKWKNIYARVYHKQDNNLYIHGAIYLVIIKIYISMRML